MRAARSLMLGTGLALWAVLAASAGPAIAQRDKPENKLLAEQLFEEGRKLARDNNWAEACPKFEASLRYDATLGTRLNLATCLEKIGKIASAWGLYRDSAELARTAGDLKRRDYALKQAAALLPRLPKLTIAGPGIPPPGFAVTRDGVAIDLAALGTALYVDPGTHEVAASAPGREPFAASVNVVEGGSASVVIPELAKSKVPEPPPQQVPPPPPPQGDEEEDEPEPLPDGPDPGRTRKLVGIGVGGAGVIAAGVGLFLGARASGTYDDAKALCGSELICESDEDFARGKDLISRARGQATVSTVLVAGGLAAVAAGAVVWFTAPKRERRERAEAAVMPIVTDRELGLSVLGRF